MIFKIKPNCFSYDDVQNVIKLVLKNGFLTGSRKFGMQSDDSDWDYIVKYDFLKEIINLNYLVKYNENSELPTLSFKIYIFNSEGDKKPFKVINVLVCVKDGEYDSWVKSTDQFIDIIKNEHAFNVSKCKDVRIAIFEQLRFINGIGNKSNKTLARRLDHLLHDENDVAF